MNCNPIFFEPKQTYFAWKGRYFWAMVPNTRWVQIFIDCNFLLLPQYRGMVHWTDFIEIRCLINPRRFSLNLIYLTSFSLNELDWITACVSEEKKTNTYIVSQGLSLTDLWLRREDKIQQEPPWPCPFTWWPEKCGKVRHIIFFNQTRYLVACVWERNLET